MIFSSMDFKTKKVFGTGASGRRLKHFLLNADEGLFVSLPFNYSNRDFVHERPPWETW